MLMIAFTTLYFQSFALHSNELLNTAFTCNAYEVNILIIREYNFARRLMMICAEHGNLC